MKIHILNQLPTPDPYLDALSGIQPTMENGRDLYITNGPLIGNDLSGCIVYYMTMHPFANDLESFVYNKHNNLNWLHTCPQIQQIWLPEHYKEYKSYVETVYKKPVVCIPFVYSLPEPRVAPSYKPDTLVDIVLFDSNDAFHRSAFKPLYICMEFYRRYPSKLGTVYILNMPDNETAYKIIESSPLRRDKKLRVFKGLTDDQIFSFFRASKQRTVFLSNSVLPEITPFMNAIVCNGLPLIHTQPEFPFGVYYEMNDIDTCIRYLADHTLQNTIGLTLEANETNKLSIATHIHHLCAVAPNLK
jgi:hypothetical protein